MGKQKFKKYDLVKIDDNLGDSMSHFTSGCEAIVIGSYADEYGGDDTNSYTLYLKSEGECSWYYEEQLTLIERNRKDLLDEWKNEDKTEDAMHSDLDWIFSNGPQVLNGATSSTIESLAACLGVNNLYGSNGEGFVYYMNSIKILSASAPYLIGCDKQGWLDFCNKHRVGNNER